MDDSTTDSTVYNVVVNHEEQYSIWPAYKTIPAGWRAAGKEGSKKECLDYIGEVWTDMRPLSLRKRTCAPSACANRWSSRQPQPGTGNRRQAGPKTAAPTTTMPQRTSPRNAWTACCI
jgi:MbtH protein